MFRTAKNSLTLDDIKDYLQKVNLSEKENFYKYYKGAVKENGSLHHGYPKYITDMHTGYFLSSPISYVSKNEKLLTKLIEIFKHNKEPKHNKKLAKSMSIFGYTFELIYLDENGIIRFTEIKPTEMFVILDDALDENIKFAIRQYKIDEQLIVEVRDSEKCVTYKGKDIQSLELDIEAEQPHYFGVVPIVLYQNNEEYQGDFEQVIDEIVAYNKTQGNTMSDMDDFNDAYLKLVNMLSTDSKDVEKMKKDKVLLLDEDGDADWLIKNVNDAWVENFKTRLQRDIHKFSFTPDLTDEQFGGNLSGISLEYKLDAMEKVRATKEIHFRDSLQRRIELICKILEITSAVEDYTDIEMVFTVKKPKNILELSQIITNLSNYLSQETLLSQLPFVDNAKDEIEKLRQEDKTRLEDYEQK